MAISREYFKCKICGEKIITRAAIAHTDYQEFAFPCPSCGSELRFGMTINNKKPSIKYTKVINLIKITPDDNIFTIKVFDSESLNPVDENRHFSPFLATARLPRDFHYYSNERGNRFFAVQSLLPVLQQLRTHADRGDWDLFDRQLKKSSLSVPNTIGEKWRIYWKLERHYCSCICPYSSGAIARTTQRIALARSICEKTVQDLIAHFTQTGQDSDIHYQINDLRRRWMQYFKILEPLYLIYYWDSKRNNLTDYTLAQKRFDELKSFYVDLFETFCRVSVIAAAIEGVVFHKKAIVETSRGTMLIEDFSSHQNGSKRDILQRLAIGDLFVPFMDHMLRNGIGHHSAKYDVLSDEIQYKVRKNKTTVKNSIEYIVFCEKVLRLYCQLEIVSEYSRFIIEPGAIRTGL